VPRQGLDTEQVLRAAEELADGGLANATFARLAERLDVRAPSLYNHVNGRAELLRLIRLRALTGLAGALAGATAGRSGEDAVRAAAHAYRAYALAHPGSYDAAQSVPPDRDVEVAEAADRLIELIGSILGAWKLQGDDAIDAIRVLRSALHGFVTLERSGEFAKPRDLDASFERLVDTLVLGLSATARH
jgi:AcrR family transcriptional regulator